MNSEAMFSGIDSSKLLNDPNEEIVVNGTRYFHVGNEETDTLIIRGKLYISEETITRLKRVTNEKNDISGNDVMDDNGGPPHDCY